MAPAGGSSQIEHDRRRAKEKAAPAVPGAASGSGAQQLITPDLVRLLAPVAAFSAFMGTARRAWGRRATTEAWAMGAVGERRTAAILVPLERKGWVVLHDRKMPRGRANIDHVAIGPQACSPSRPSSIQAR